VTRTPRSSTRKLVHCLQNIAMFPRLMIYMACPPWCSFFSIMTGIFSRLIPFPQMKKPDQGLYFALSGSSSVCSIGCGMRSLRWHRAQSFSLTAFPSCWYVAYTPERSSSFVCNLQRRHFQHITCFYYVSRCIQCCDRYSAIIFSFL
jgi:hypothetical protein